MTDLLDYIFNCLVTVWGLITGSWVLAMPFLLAILALVIGLINGSREGS